MRLFSESADIDLDVLLNELYALESQLNNGGPILGLSPKASSGTTAVAKSRPPATSTANTLVPPAVPAKPSPQRGKSQPQPSPSDVSPVSTHGSTTASSNTGSNSAGDYGAKLQVSNKK